MSKFATYDKVQYIALMTAIVLTASIAGAVISFLLNINLFEIYLGTPGFLLISIIVISANYFEERLEPWLTR